MVVVQSPFLNPTSSLIPCLYTILERRGFLTPASMGATPSELWFGFVLQSGFLSAIGSFWVIQCLIIYAKLSHVCLRRW